MDLDDPRTSKTIIENDPRYPKRFQQHSHYPQYYMIHAELDQPKDIPNVRTLKTKWSTVIPNALLKNGKPVYDDNPLNRPIDVQAGYYTMPKTLDMVYGFAIGQDSANPVIPPYDPDQGPPQPKVKVTTTAGEPIFLQIEQEVRMFSCQKNVKNLPKFMAKGGMFTNSEAVKFQGVDFTPLELLVCHIRLSRPHFEFGQVFYSFDYDLLVAVDKSGWCEKKRNAGFHERDFIEKITPHPNPEFRPAITYVPYLKAIQIGPVENPHPPSQPVLLTSEGRAYRSPNPNKKEENASTPQNRRTGPIMTTEGIVGGGVGLTDQDFAKSELKFYPRLAIPFNKYIPLT